MGRDLPNALTLPCREEELQRAKENLSSPAAVSWEGGVWLGAEAGASTAGITLSFLGRWEGRK